MPSASEILAGLTRIANDAWPLALVWHALLGLGAVGIVLGWRPSGRAAGVLTASLPLSVGVLAFAYGNPFNGAVFSLLAAALAALALRSETDPVTLRAGWEGALGLVLFVFGWAYPHFLGGSPLAYLVAAPTGLVPCPTLSTMLGLALMGIAPSGRAWGLTVAALATLYALVGALRLGVAIDLAMLAGVLGVVVASWRRAEPTRRSLAGRAI